MAILIVAAFPSRLSRYSFSRRSKELNPNYSSGRFVMAVALVELGRLDEARAEVRAGLALNPGFTIRRYREGGWSRRQSDAAPLRNRTSSFGIFYFLPMNIALAKKCDNTAQIVLFCLLLGWIPLVDSDAKCNAVDSIGSSTKSRVSHSEHRPSARFPGDKDGSARRNIEPFQ